MRWILKKQIINVLIKKLNGNLDLVHYILKFNNEDIQSIKDWYIEKDFYNWLNYNIFDRNHLVLKRNRFYFSIPEGEKFKYYLENYKKLGLTKYKENDLDGLRRIKSLNECFNSNWWKTTEKDYVEWRLIHTYINHLNYFT